MVTGFFAFAINWTTMFMYIGLFINNKLDVDFKQISTRERYSVYYSNDGVSSGTTINFIENLDTLGQTRELELWFWNTSSNSVNRCILPIGVFGIESNFYMKCDIDGEVLVHLVPAYHWTPAALTCTWDRSDIVLKQAVVIF